MLALKYTDTCEMRFVASSVKSDGSINSLCCTCTYTFCCMCKTVNRMSCMVQACSLMLCAEHRPTGIQWKSVQWASQVAQPLEGGRECMIWPEHGLLRAGGESFVIDAYSQGAMYSMTEVRAIVMLFLMCLHCYPGTTA